MKHIDNIPSNTNSFVDISKLPQKMAKWLVFCEWILYNIPISDIERETTRNIVKMYDTQEIQYEFYNTFAKEEKQITKTMKKYISQQKKIPKNAEPGAAIICDIPKNRNQILKEEYMNKLIELFALSE